MKNKNNFERFENQNLMKFQRQLLFQIQCTYKYFLGEVLACLLFCIIFGIFILLFTTYGINNFYNILPKIFIAFCPSIVGLIQIKRIWPYLRETNFYLKKLRLITLNNNIEQLSSSQFIHIINSYLNKLHFLIFHKRNSRKESSEDIFHQLSHYIKIQYSLDFIAIIIGGIIIFGLFLYLMIEYDFLFPKPFVYLSFLSFIISYSLMLFYEEKAQHLISLWMSGYIDLKSWGDNLEQLPSEKESIKFNEE